MWGNKINWKSGEKWCGGITFHLIFHMQNLCKFSRDIRCPQFESSDGNVPGWKRERSLLLYVVATLIRQNNYRENYYSSNTYKTGRMSLYLQFPFWRCSICIEMKKSCHQLHGYSLLWCWRSSLTQCMHLQCFLLVAQTLSTNIQ